LRTLRFKCLDLPWFAAKSKSSDRKARKGNPREVRKEDQIERRPF